MIRSPSHARSNGRRLAALLAAVALAALQACAPGPDVPLPAGPPGDYPDLMPIDALLAQADLPAA